MIAIRDRPTGGCRSLGGCARLGGIVDPRPGGGEWVKRGNNNATSEKATMTKDRRNETKQYWQCVLRHEAGKHVTAERSPGMVFSDPNMVSNGRCGSCSTQQNPHRLQQQNKAFKIDAKYQDLVLLAEYRRRNAYTPPYTLCVYCPRAEPISGRNLPRTPLKGGHHIHGRQKTSSLNMSHELYPPRPVSSRLITECQISRKQTAVVPPISNMTMHLSVLSSNPISQPSSRHHHRHPSITNPKAPVPKPPSQAP